jgi:hypothetical protein
MTTKLFVNPSGPRPDFRLVISFLWKDFHNVDTDGDSHNPASRAWTELYIANRECPSEIVEVLPARLDPLVLKVQSESEVLAHRVAYFLARETAGEVAAETGASISLGELATRLGADFDLDRAIRRADQSIWRSATEANPYPKLRGHGNRSS